MTNVAQTRPLRAAWVYDVPRHKALNAAGHNYWDLYTAEILERIGLTAEAIAPADTADPAVLCRYSHLFIGEGDYSRCADPLTAWVQSGGVLVTFATAGLDELLGVRFVNRLEQPNDEYTIAAYMRLEPGPLTDGIHSALYPDQPLIIASPVRQVTLACADLVAELFIPSSSAPGRGCESGASGCAAVTSRRLGDGFAFHFAFSLPQTMCVIHQGRPVERDVDGDGLLRSMDARVVAENEPEVGYTDELHVLLRNMIAVQPMPLVHECPPAGGQVPDAVFFLGGDDEAVHGHQVPASDFMREEGLPYHINCMWSEGQFQVTPEEAAHIRSNGHELSVHYDFITGYDHPCGFSEEGVCAQSEAFRATYGHSPEVSVNHCARWVGWCEPARWMLAQGQIGDNSWFGHRSPPLNPVNSIDLSFGTALPRCLMDDWRNGNERLRFVEQHVVAYEVGYLGDETRFDVLHRAVDLAVAYRLTMNLFYHPVYIATNEACRAAIRELKRYVAAKDIVAGFMGNDALARWWLARADARVEAVLTAGSSVSFLASCDHPGGFIVKVPIGEDGATSCTVGGLPATVLVAREFGRNWAYIPLEPGTNEVCVSWGTNP